MSNIDNVISQLNNISNSLAVSCPIVSTTSTGKCKPLSVHQQKQLIKNATGAAIDTIKIGNIINKIIQDNVDCACDLNAVDKEGILLAMKMHNTQNAQDKADMQHVIDKLSKLQLNITKQVQEHGIELQLASPTLARDSAINSEFIEAFKDKQLSNSEIISNYFVYDIVKYIDSFKVGKEQVSFADCTNTKDYVAIVTHMPTSLVTAVAEFSTETKDAINKIFREHNVPLQSSAF